MDDINKTEPHYIRCIKPNSVKKPKVFENKFVVSQLQSGVRLITPTSCPLAMAFPSQIVVVPIPLIYILFWACCL